MGYSQIVCRANTLKLSKIVEPFVREWLAKEYKKEFIDGDQKLELIIGGKHKFDAVSIDGSIVADIKASEKFAPGSFRAAITDLYWLSLIKADKKILVLTDSDFHKKFMKNMIGKEAPNIEIRYCQLSEGVKEQTRETHLSAQNENVKRQ